MKVQLTLTVEVTDASPCNTLEEVAGAVERATGRMSGFHNPEVIEQSEINEQSSPS